MGGLTQAAHCSPCHPLFLSTSQLGTYFRLLCLVRSLRVASSLSFALPFFAFLLSLCWYVWASSPLSLFPFPPGVCVALLRCAIPWIPCSLPRSCLTYFCACRAPLLRALPARRFFALPASPGCLLPTALASLVLSPPPAVSRFMFLLVQLLTFLLGTLLLALLARWFLSLPLLSCLPGISVQVPTFPLANTPARRFFALLLFLRSCAQWPSSPDVARASGLSGLLFEVWLALPECGVVSLASRVSLRFGFAAVLPLLPSPLSFAVLAPFPCFALSIRPAAPPPSRGSSPFLVCVLVRFI